MRAVFGLFIAFVLLLAGAGQACAASANDLAGAWKGGYVSGDQGDSNLFDVTITPTGQTTFIGRAVELNVFAPEQGLYFLVSDLAGTISADGQLRFNKTYVSNRGISHTVSYSGRLVDDGRRVAGSYQLDGVKGVFELAR